MYFMMAILKIQHGGHAGVCANANIEFLILHTLMIPKMYRFANLQKCLNEIIFVNIVNLTISYGYMASALSLITIHRERLFAIATRYSGSSTARTTYSISVKLK